MVECKIKEVVADLIEYYNSFGSGLSPLDLQRINSSPQCDNCPAKVLVSDAGRSFEVITQGAMCAEGKHGLKVEVK
jgi:hypothetical protein